MPVKHRGFSIEKVTSTPFYGLFDASILCCVLWFDAECSGIGSFFCLTTALSTTTADAKVAAIMALSAAIPTNAWAGGTAANERTIMVTTTNAKFF
jgi:hypothetical protein